MSTILTILIGVLLFGCMIFVHEFGHFFTAKLFGIPVNQFAIGMGPRLFHFQRGETEYSLRLFPIGGFCAMEGEDEESENARAFNNQKVWKRMIVVAAGGIMNVLLGLVLMFVIQVQEPEAFLSTKVMDTGVGVTAGAESFERGDRIYSINGYRILCDYDISYSLSRYSGEEMEFVVRRGSEKVAIPGVKVDHSAIKKGEEKAYVFLVEAVPKNFGTTVAQTVKQLVSFSRMVYSSLFDLLTGRYGLNEMSGPVGTVDAIGQVAASGENFVESLNNVLWMMALITVNLGLFNLLPVPALDGGRLFFLLIEAIRRKPIPPKYEGLVHTIGLFLLFGLMIVVTFNDILKLIRG